MPATRPQLAGTFGMVASTHWLASAAGDGRAGARRQRVRRGGRGRLRAARRRAAPQRARGRGAARSSRRPTTRRRPSCVDRVRRRPAPPSRTTATSASTWSRAPARSPPRCPGAVEAWLTLLRDHGTRRLADVLAYAIGYAEHGHPLLPTAVAHHRPGRATCSPSDWTTSAELYLPGGAPPPAGAAVPQPGAGRHLPAAGRGRGGRPGRTGRPASTPPGTAWREGFVAEAIDAFARRPFRHPGDGRHPGRAHRRRPGRVRPRPTSRPRRTVPRRGGAQDRPVGPGTGAAAATGPARRLHRRGTRSLHRGRRAPGRPRCAKLAFADREAWYGDAAPVPSAAAARPGVHRGPAGADRRPRQPRAAARRARRPRRRGCPPAACRPARAADVPAAGGGARRADRRPSRGDPRRHLPPRRGRPLGQHDLGHPERWLAAELAGHSRARVPARQPAADDVAGGGAAGQPDPGPPPAHHAQPDPHLPRRRTGASPAARPAATSRTSGSSCCCCPTSSGGRRCRRRSRRRAGTAPRCRARSTRARPTRASWCVESRLGEAVIDGLRRRGTGWSWPTRGRSAACRRSAATRRPACSGPRPTPAAAGLRRRPLTRCLVDRTRVVRPRAAPIRGNGAVPQQDPQQKIIALATLD